MRILHITSSKPDLGGVSRYVCDLSEALVELGHEVAIAGHQPPSRMRPVGVAWLSAPVSGSIMDMWRAASLLSRGERYDIVHAHFRKSALIGRRVATLHRAPLLFTLHLTDIPMDLLRRALTDFGDVAHAASREAARWLRERGNLPDERIRLIPHGVAQDRFPLASEEDQLKARGALKLPAEAIVASYVGRFEHPKNESWIVDAARSIPNVTFVMMGAGPRQALLEGAPVRLLPYGDPLPLYQAADAVLLPSAQEGFSLACIEAMSVGRPVLRTRTAGTEETIVDGVTGLACDIDRQAFINAAKFFLSKRDRLKEMGVAAAAHVRTHLRYDQQVERTSNLYKELIARNKKRLER